MKNEKGTIVLAGGVIGVIAAILVFFGNPANMGFCIACFLRDTTGALGLHSAAAVQYIRPEIIGLVLGACIISLAKKEFRPRGGSAPVTRFTLGAFVMIGCLMFLGCPFRMILRLAGGDGNALFGLVGFVCGILTGTVFLKKGYTLKRSYKMPKLEGSIYPAFQIVMLLLLVAAPAFIHFTEPEGGPGAKHAAILISLAAVIISKIIPVKFPVIAYCSLIGLLLASPICPAREYVIEAAGKINFTAPLTMVGAYAGISISDQLKEFARQGWKMLLIAALVMVGTFTCSAIIAQILLSVTHVI